MAVWQRQRTYRAALECCLRWLWGIWCASMSRGRWSVSSTAPGCLSQPRDTRSIYLTPYRTYGRIIWGEVFFFDFCQIISRLQNVWWGNLPDQYRLPTELWKNLPFSLRSTATFHFCLFHFMSTWFPYLGGGPMGKWLGGAPRPPMFGWVQYIRLVQDGHIKNTLVHILCRVLTTP